MKNPHPLIGRVATRYLLAQEIKQVVPKKYLQALLAAIGPEHDEEWGIYRYARKPLEWWLYLIAKGDDLYGVPKDREALLENLENRGVASWEMDALKIVPEPKVRPPKPAQVDEKAWALLDTAVGNPLLQGELYALQSPEFNRHIRELVHVLGVLKAKYPFAWAVYNKRVKQLYLTRKGVGTENGSWADWIGGGRLSLTFKSVISVSLLLHEIGHVYEDNFDIMTLMDLYGMGRPPHVSGYAEKNTSEDFAETFMYYWINRGHLKRKAPTKYADMHRRITTGK